MESMEMSPNGVILAGGVFRGEVPVWIRATEQEVADSLPRN